MKRKYDVSNIANSTLSDCIGEWVKGERNRAILRRYYIDGVTHDQLAEEFEMSANGIRRILRKESNILFRHI